MYIIIIIIIINRLAQKSLNTASLWLHTQCHVDMCHPVYIEVTTMNRQAYSWYCTVTAKAFRLYNGHNIRLEYL